MTPTRRKSDPKRPDWTNVVAGLAIAAVAAVGSRFVANGDGLAALQARAGIMPDRMDRELDSLERRILTLEARCNEAQGVR